MQHSNCNNALESAVCGHLMQSKDAPAILVANPADNFRVLYVNAGAVRSLGYSAEELQGMMVSDFVPTFSEERGVRLTRLLAEKERIVFESLHKTRDGSILPVELELSSFRYQEQPVVMGIWRDITLNKQVDARLTERMRLEQQLSSLAASVPGCIFSIRVDADGHTSMPFASVGITDLFGLQPDDIRKDVAPLRALYHPEDLPRHLAAVAQSSRDLTPFRSEVRASHPEQGERVIEIHSRPQREADGGTIWHGLMLDSTERKRM
jgi:PAS domain S-box-containing protein